ncbi:MAG: helix-turn-helix domain-containing protein [Nocardioides sp.]|uniref:helix-turn-helix transcriptional regulator n=1 Tax=Nocardioides sp. TaxID=35761 RepID=UPI0039E720C9
MNNRNHDDTNHTAVPATVARCSCGAHPGDEMLTLAELLRVPVATLRYWRHLGAGPHSFRIGRFVRYWRSDVNAWIEKQSRRPHGHPSAHRHDDQPHQEHRDKDHQEGRRS